MLILTRRCGEVVCVGEQVRVRVLSVTGNKIRLGFEAPASVRVDREEVRQRIEQFSEAARVEEVGGLAV